MEILYCWIERYNIIEKQGINFGGEFLFEFNEEKSLLNIIRNKEYIKDFFNYKDKYINIRNITAICGENGSGKTTVLKYLLSTFNSLTNIDNRKTNINNDFKFIFAFVDYDKKNDGRSIINIICDNKKRFTIKSQEPNIVIYNEKDKNKNKVKLISLIDNYDECIDILKKTGYVYYSPIIDMDYGIPNNDDKNKNYSNISLKNQLDNYLKYNIDYEITGGYDNLSDKNNLKSLDKFWDQLIKDQLNLIQSLNNKIISKNFHIPDEILMYPITSYNKAFYNSDSLNKIGNIEDIYRRDNANITKTIFEIEIYKIIKTNYITSKMDNKTLIGEYYYVIMDTFFKELYNKHFNQNVIQYVHKQLLKKELPRIKTINNILNELKKYFIFILKDAEDEQVLNIIKNYEKLKGNKKNYQSEIEDYFNKYIDLIKCVEEFYSNNKIKNSIDIKEEKDILYSMIKININTIKEITEIIEKFQNIPTVKKLNVNCFKGYSSGETGKLNLLTCLNKGTKDLKQENIIFFIDEGESYYHPEWKRNYLNDIIEFFNDTTSNQKFQFIFTSNSSYLISDLPKENVILIKEGKVTNNIKGFKNTFSANIHTLLAKSFFMENGTIGEFAKIKINNIINILNGELDEIWKNKLKIQQLINIIGEPLIRNKLNDLLMSRLQEYGKQNNNNKNNLIRYYENKLADLKK